VTPPPPPSSFDFKFKCARRVGFLFPHPCERTSPEGCPDCQNGQVADPYRSRSRYLYEDDYDVYDTSLTGYALSALSDHFTEADGESLMKTQDDFEDDMSAS